MADVARGQAPRGREYLSHKLHGAEVHVDGGVNRETAELVGGLGVDILVVGSALWLKGRDMGREIRLIRALADEGYQYELNGGKPPIRATAWSCSRRSPRTGRPSLQADDRGGRHPRAAVPNRGWRRRTRSDDERDWDLLLPASAEQERVSHSVRSSKIRPARRRAPRGGGPGTAIARPSAPRAAAGPRRDRA